MDAVTKKLEAIEADNKEVATGKFEKQLEDMKAMKQVKVKDLTATEIRRKCYINAINLALRNKTNADEDVMEESK